jgi:hypothetical protein
MLDEPRLLKSRVCAPRLVSNAVGLRWIDWRPASARPRNASREAASAAGPRPYCFATRWSR